MRVSAVGRGRAPRGTAVRWPGAVAVVAAIVVVVVVVVRVHGDREAAGRVAAALGPSIVPSRAPAPARFAHPPRQRHWCRRGSRVIGTDREPPSDRPGGGGGRDALLMSLRCRLLRIPSHRSNHPRLRWRPGERAATADRALSVRPLQLAPPPDGRAGYAVAGCVSIAVQHRALWRIAWPRSPGRPRRPGPRGPAIPATRRSRYRRSPCPSALPRGAARREEAGGKGRRVGGFGAGATRTRTTERRDRQTRSGSSSSSSSSISRSNSSSTAGCTAAAVIQRRHRKSVGPGAAPRATHGGLHRPAAAGAGAAHPRCDRRAAGAGAVATIVHARVAHLARSRIRRRDVASCMSGAASSLATASGAPGRRAPAGTPPPSSCGPGRAALLTATGARCTGCRCDSRPPSLPPSLARLRVVGVC